MVINIPLTFSANRTSELVPCCVQVFIVRKSSQPMSLALSVQNRLSDRANVDHYLIEATDYGMRLQGSAHYFHSIPSLIAHYSDNL